MAVDKESSSVRIPYPKSVIFIIGNEFCERFSYYGMKAILVLYFRFILHYSDDSATQAYHIFAMACYFTPVIGAIIADSLLGKFWTILSISIVYAGGNILLSIASINGTVALTFIGLAFIALGTGGIKPCVSAFGGDQFKPEQSTQLKQFFSLFYISINAGSLISTFITPILRQDIGCMGRSDCYPLAFGVPAVLMVVALLLFIVGRFITNYVMVPPQKDNVVVMVVKCVCHALGRKMFGKTEKKEHWLDYSDDQYDTKTIGDVKILMRVLFLYLPLPIFWSLFDQTGSRWTLQALRMNGQLGGFVIKPDQIQVINPLLIILMIPVYEYVLYPLFRKMGIVRPLQRMTVGGILAGVSFVICFFIQLSIQGEQPVEIDAGHNHGVLINGLDCDVKYYNHVVKQFQAAVEPNIDRVDIQKEFAVEIIGGGANCKLGNITVPNPGFLDLNDTQNAVYFLTTKIFNNPPSVDVAIFNNTLIKPANGGAQLFTIFSLSGYTNQTFASTETNNAIIPVVITPGTDTTPAFGYLVDYEVEIKGKDVVISVDSKSQTLDLNQGATYIQLISGDLNKDVRFDITNVVPKNQMSVFLQIIPYFVITCAEIMFSVTGLEFSYSQAPKSMKSVLQACWLLTVAFGNLIIAIIADAQIFSSQAYEFLFFGGLMMIDIAIFAGMAYIYVPSNIAEQEEEPENNDDAATFPSKGKRWDEDD